MLLPREHGAYGQLLFPLVAALLIGRPAAGAYLLAAAASAAFLAHESLLVVLGQRGSRAAREQGRDARGTLALLGGFCGVTAVVSLLVLSRTVLWSLGLPLVLVMLVAVALFKHRERSTAGEILVAAALASLSVPIALAGGVTRVAALTLFLVFASVFVTATIAVRAMIGRVKKAGGPSAARAGVLTLGILAVLAILAGAGWLAPVASYAALPVFGVALGIIVRPPSPRHLRTIGWTLVGATALTAVLLVAALA